jgi:3-isopropylmalate/(R)-2-methylmalate dehydratase small subunit
VWGLKQVGIRALIGTSFAGIFYDNCQRNGVLAIELSQVQLKRMAAVISVAATAQISVNLPEQIIELADGSVIPFDIDPLRKQSLLLGLDAIGATLQRAGQIREFEARHLAQNPWL